MKPIPLKLLTHSVTYNEYQGNTGEKVTFGSDITLLNVKVEERKIYAKLINSVEVIGNGYLFYDCFNSKGLSNAPKPQSKITYNGKQYTVEDVDILRGYGNNPHHYEVLLK